MKLYRFFLVLLLMPQMSWSAELVAPLILMDKAKNLLHLADYDPQKYKIIKTFHATTGRVKGDKTDEGDLKTPEGIYFFTAHLTPPSLKKKFGVRAFYMNYPNPYDKMAGRTGFDIMLHATDTPERLKKDFDSEGCIVLSNEDIDSVKKYISLKSTPILVFSELSDSWLYPEKDKKLYEFIHQWITAWKNKDVEKYIHGYHSEFSYKGKNLKQWKQYKESLNKRYHTIEIDVSSPRFYRHPKYSVVTFEQDYRSKNKKGRTLFRSKGLKKLFIAQEQGEYKIISEQFNP
ncbi:MAG: hypothetical protein CL678_12095 [Bdellovibrionaceae bacterium]|nr:hypothetical protein [Pseudobdellovibrionaceae bacterium]|tara:strand:+ start:1355 stop:2221 length:867 start_codon:yes stop_codon:yes gene_type:complete